MLNRFARRGRTRQASRGNSRCSALATTSLRLPDICKRRAFASGRAAEQVGHPRSCQYRRRRAAWHPSGGFVDLVDQQRVALPGAAAQVVIAEPDHRASCWKQEQQPAVLETELGDPVKPLHEHV